MTKPTEKVEEFKLEPRLYVCTGMHPAKKGPPLQIWSRIVDGRASESDLLAPKRPLSAHVGAVFTFTFIAGKDSYYTEGESRPTFKENWKDVAAIAEWKMRSQMIEANHAADGMQRRAKEEMENLAGLAEYRKFYSALPSLKLRTAFLAVVIAEITHP